MSKYQFQSLLCPSENVTADQLATDRALLAFERSIAHLHRRGFLTILAGAAAGATLTAGRTARGQTATGPSAADVLNFALNLEYLEANFYLYVTTGSGLATADIGSNGAAVLNPPGKLQLDAETFAVASALATDEKNHVELLRSTITGLGSTPVQQPAIDLGAKGAITTQAQFLAAARQFTALGGSAYCGSAQLLVSNTTVLTTASQILGAEGQHAGALDYLCSTLGVLSPAIDAQDIPPTATQFIIAAPQTALAPARNTSQVLGVAYGVSTPATTTPPVGTTMGGFFPAGFNGAVKST